MICSFLVDLLNELARREKDAGIFPEADVDLFMKASAAQGVKSSLITDYTLKVSLLLSSLQLDSSCKYFCFKSV